MKRLVTAIGFLFAALSAAGCFPYHFTLVPGATGRVVDSHAGTPIRQGLVTLTDRYRPDDHVSTARTSADGRFEIPAKQMWSLFITPFDPAPATAVVSFQADGYADVEKRISVTVMGPAMTDLGTIPMTRGTQ